jgi:hypothetical protein
VHADLSRGMRSIFHWGGVQPGSWIEADSGDIRERGTRGMGHGLWVPRELRGAILASDLD